MKILCAHPGRFSGAARRRFARRFVSFNNSQNCRHLASYLPLWDGTDPALRGLTTDPGGRP